MFVDYYGILEIPFTASQDEIKAAYKKQALKWHPDRNPGTDTHARMVSINEAHVMLSDQEGRQKYDIEYQLYKEYQRKSYTQQEERSRQEYQREETREHARQEQPKQKQETFTETFEDSDYEVYDETLKRWMSNARKQAASLAKQTIEDIVGMSKAGGQAMGEAALKGVVRYIIFGIIMLIIFKACTN